MVREGSRVSNTIQTASVVADEVTFLEKLRWDGSKGFHNRVIGTSRRRDKKLVESAVLPDSPDVRFGHLVVRVQECFVHITCH